MKLIAFVILGMGMMGSAVVQAQEAGQGSAVPRQPVLVAQAGTPASPTPPPVVTAAPAVTPGVTAAIVVTTGLVVAGIAASGSSGGAATPSHH